MTRRMGSDFQTVAVTTRAKVSRNLRDVFNYDADEVAALFAEFDEGYPNVEPTKIYGGFINRFLEQEGISRAAYWVAHRSDKGRKEHLSPYGSELEVSRLLRELVDEMSRLRQSVAQLQQAA